MTASFYAPVVTIFSTEVHFPGAKRAQINLSVTSLFAR